MASTLQITFLDTNILYEDIKIHLDVGGTESVPREVFYPVRSGFGQVQTYYPGGTSSATGLLAANFSLAWNYDYKNLGGSGNMTATYSVNTVTITLLNPAWQFGFSGTTISGTALSSGSISFVVSNDVVEPTRDAQFSSFEAAPSPCVDMLANFTATGGSGTYNIYSNNTQVLTGATSPFQLSLVRGQFYSIDVFDSNGVSIKKSLTLRVPRKVIPADITITATALSAGSTVSIEREFISSWINPYEYSLDGTNYQTQNYFSGIAPGDYTLYVRDAFGCVTEKTFTVDGVTSLTETVFNLSEINALRFALVENGKKNHKNTLSCNELKQLNYLFAHQYRITDTIKTQFKTNAQFIDAYVLDAVGNKTSLTPIRLTENIGNEIKTTCTYFSLGGGRSAIYFGIVNRLNPVDDTVIETLNYGYTLPQFANRVGDYVTVDGLGQVAINSISYSEEYDAFIAEFNIEYTGTPETRNVYAIYNLQPYEIYEFEADMSLLPESFNVVIDAGTDANNIAKTVVSERVIRVEDSDNLVEIDYWDSRNKGDMNYQTGIKHKILIPAYLDYVGDQKTEGYEGDQEYYVTENTIFDAQRLIIERLSGEMAHKMRLVVSHETLIINGIKYKLSEAPDIKGTITHNFKSFSVILKRSGNQFLDNSQENISGSTEVDLIGGAIEASEGKSLILWTKQNG